MNIHRMGFALVATGLFFGATTAFAQTAMNVSPQRHPNLAGAQAHIREASNLISQAQSANHDQLGGHAANAKRLLDQAADELKAAALTANGN